MLSTHVFPNIGTRSIGFSIHWIISFSSAFLKLSMETKPHVPSPSPLIWNTVPSTGEEPVVIHYILWPSSCYSLFSNHVLHDLFRSSHSSIYSSPQKFNSTLSQSRSSHRWNLNILFSLAGWRCGGAEGQAAWHHHHFPSINTSSLLLFLRLLLKEKEHFNPFTLFSLPRNELFIISFYFLVFPPSLLSPACRELSVKCSHSCVFHPPAFFYHLFFHFSFLSPPLGHDRLDSNIYCLSAAEAFAILTSAVWAILLQMKQLIFDNSSDACLIRAWIIAWGMIYYF